VLVDGFTIVAQIINFLILMFLLRRFLYRPILETMENRENQIAARLEEAEQKKLAAEDERLRYQQKTQQFQDQLAEKQREAEEDIETWRKDALRHARGEVDETIANWQRTVEQEKDIFRAGLRQFIIRQTYSVASQAVRELANAELEEAMVGSFLRRIQEPGFDMNQLLEGGESSDSQGLTLRSAFDLPSGARDRIDSIIREKFGPAILLRVEKDPSLAAGIELAGPGGRQISWNLERYLETLEDSLEVAVQEMIGERRQSAGQMEA
jgi:F-type H+-transporting ATPase subunit b